MSGEHAVAGAAANYKCERKNPFVYDQRVAVPLGRRIPLPRRIGASGSGRPSVMLRR